MDAWAIALVIMGLCLPLVGYIAFKWFRIFNSVDGERYLKRRMQGPYVPLSAEENAEDAARKSKTPARPQ